ncbi:MAG TPA: nucleic acid/nucleotide deaminase domain-containing protein [Clostridia bacterium]
MPYEITISGINTTFNKCIDWVACKVDTPSTSNARTNFVSNYMNISGFIGTDEVTIDLYNWAMIPVNDSNVFRNVKLTVKDANDNVIETVSFPNAFVEFYRESYMRDKGFGKFDLQLKQKIDKNLDVGVSDSSADEKGAAGSKVLESVLGSTPKSGIMDKGASEVGEGTTQKAPKQVGYGETDLSLRAIQYRAENNIFDLRNLVVADIEIDGVRTLKVFESTERIIVKPSGKEEVKKVHSEKVLVEERNAAEKSGQTYVVHRVYTEREPCILGGHDCKKLLAKELPDTEVTYSFEYGEKDSRDRGNAALAQELKKLGER